ncbi:MAG: acetyl-CoA carboxylase biotin carboxyl carrier protein [Bacteroidales bacterium]|nr:acetyl-CoA carboxylase biotin carboxyl carrier protein [Bacteroidales bacterium]
MDYKELKDFIKAVAKSGVSEVDIKTEKMRLSVKVGTGGKGATHTETIIQQVPVHTALTTGPILQQPMQQNLQTQVQPPVNTDAKAETEDNSKYITVKSPMVGTFYRKPSPDKDTFVNIGDNVKENTVVCIIEAMKLFNEIEAEVSGKIVKVLVEDASPVEFGQDLFLVDPS